MAVNLGSGITGVISSFVSDLSKTVSKALSNAPTLDDTFTQLFNWNIKFDELNPMNITISSPGIKKSSPEITKSFNLGERLTEFITEVGNKLSEFSKEIGDTFNRIISGFDQDDSLSLTQKNECKKRFTVECLTSLYKPVDEMNRHLELMAQQIKERVQPSQKTSKRNKSYSLLSASRQYQLGVSNLFRPKYIGPIQQSFTREVSKDKANTFKNEIQKLTIKGLSHETRGIHKGLVVHGRTNPKDGEDAKDVRYHLDFYGGGGFEISNALPPQPNPEYFGNGELTSEENQNIVNAYYQLAQKVTSEEGKSQLLPNRKKGQENCHTLLAEAIKIGGPQENNKPKMHQAYSICPYTRQFDQCYKSLRNLDSVFPWVE